MTDPQHSRDPLVVVKRAPFNAETPPWALEQTPTPTEISTCAATSPFHPSLLRRGGCGSRARWPGRSPLSLADVQAAPAREIPAVLECAGNDRLGMTPLPPGEPWGAAR